MHEIRNLRADDRDQWQPLWDGYLRFYRQHLPAAVTDRTFARLIEPGVQPHGLVAERQGTLVGFAHYLFHPSSWSLQPMCYLEDLFVDNQARGGGIWAPGGIAGAGGAIGLLLGGALVAIVLTLFLYDLRTAFISLTAIPLSLLIAVVVLNLMGATLNTITLGGLAIAIGEVVDDAIIDVENIFRRLRGNRASASPRPNFDVILDASLEVRSAVVYATFVVALVFFPVLSMTGVQGKIFAPLGVAYILAILASLGVFNTVVLSTRERRRDLGMLK